MNLRGGGGSKIKPPRVPCSDLSSVLYKERGTFQNTEREGSVRVEEAVFEFVGHRGKQTYKGGQSLPPYFFKYVLEGHT